MKFQFDRCKDRGKIVKVDFVTELVERELKEAQNDPKSSERSIREGNYKWSIVQSYYAMFHAFRGLLFSRGYREKSHVCLKFAIEALFVDKGLISCSLLEDFDFAMKARERADYSYTYNDSLAENMLKSSKKLIIEVEKLL